MLWCPYIFSLKPAILLKFKLKMINTYMLYLQNQVYIQLPPRQDAQCRFDASNCY